MNELFLSYDSKDRAIAQQLADALEGYGWSVWWDREIPFGKAFDLVIEEQLNAARCVVVVWSKESVRSRWVKTEAAVAAERDCLVPLLIDNTVIPLEFKRIQTAMMQGWNGDKQHPEFVRLVDAIRGMLGTSARPPEPAERASLPPPANRWRAKLAWGGAIAVLALIALVVAKKDLYWPADNAARPSEPSEDVSTKQSPATGAGVPAVTKDAAPASAGAGRFMIKIGDMVSDGVPGAGAGNIESPGAEDIYEFNAVAGQRGYFHMFEYHKSMAYLKWKLTDPDGTEIFNNCLGCAAPGTQTLRKGGKYVLTVGSRDDPATGVYRFKIFNVPPPHEFPIKVGDMIKENVPGPGAGNIESPGAENIYKFTAAAGQRVYFHMFEHDKSMDYLRWKLSDPDGAEIFNNCLGCNTPGTQTLRKGGAYVLKVGSQNDPSGGIYRFKLFNVPAPHEFSIKVGETVRENVPGPGAGNIESPGAEDIYKFAAAAGQRVYFQMLEYEQGMAYLKWRLTDQDGTEIFNTCLGCGTPGAQTLRKGGAYTLRVGSESDPSTGVYRLQITSVTGSGG